MWHEVERTFAATLGTQNDGKNLEPIMQTDLSIFFFLIFFFFFFFFFLGGGGLVQYFINWLFSLPQTVWQRQALYTKLCSGASYFAYIPSERQNYNVKTNHVLKHIFYFKHTHFKQELYQTQMKQFV